MNRFWIQVEAWFVGVPYIGPLLRRHLMMRRHIAQWQTDDN